jgi:hypothetical protein
MFNVDQYRVWFKHEPTVEGNGISNLPFRGRTTCVVAIDDDASESVVAQAVSYCSPSDNFSRAVGRKVALSHALANFDKETRSKFWQTYWETLRNV